MQTTQHPGRELEKLSWTNAPAKPVICAKRCAWKHSVKKPRSSACTCGCKAAHQVWPKQQRAAYDQPACARSSQALGDCKALAATVHRTMSRKPAAKSCAVATPTAHAPCLRSPRNACRDPIGQDHAVSGCGGVWHRAWEPVRRADHTTSAPVPDCAAGLPQCSKRPQASPCASMARKNAAQ